jgi:hypothetical protein
MRTPLPFVLAAAIGLATSLHVPSADAGGLYLGLELPVAVAAPVVTVPPITVLTDDDPALIVTSSYCCGPGWRGYGWHDYGWREGYQGYARAAYAYPVHGRSAYAHPGSARGHEVVHSGRR